MPADVGASVDGGEVGGGASVSANCTGVNVAVANGRGVEAINPEGVTVGFKKTLPNVARGAEVGV
jgi:hypothetical protein